MRVAAHFFSIVFHPLFVLLYMTLVLLWTNPFSFGWYHLKEADTLLIILVMTTIVLPALAVAMMKALGWVESFQLATRHERIGPYIVTGIMYLSLYLHLTKATVFPDSLRVAVLGSLISLWVCFFINNFSKVSIHAAGMGGLVMMTFLTKLKFGYDQAQIGIAGGMDVLIPVDWILYGTIFIAGMVCTARLFLAAHQPREVYAGFGLGMLSLLIAFLFVG